MLHIHSTETFGSVDGPGIRYVIFLQGCQMRCQYCHNPDSWKTGVGETVSVDDLIDKAARYRTYWGDKGGITVSGGEALLQMGALTQLFRKAHERGINTCLDTSAQPFTRREPWFGKFEELMRYTDTVLLDIKHIRPEGHKQLTIRHSETGMDPPRPRAWYHGRRRPAAGTAPLPRHAGQHRAGRCVALSYAGNFQI